MKIKPLSALSVRTSNCLSWLGLRRREDILRAVKDRTLHPSNPKARNFGKKSLAEVRAWLGLKLELTGQQVHAIRARIACGLRRDGLTFAEVGHVLRISKWKAQQLVARGERLKREGKTLSWANTAKASPRMGRCASCGAASCSMNFSQKR